jgi:hypothetical protein
LRRFIDDLLAEDATNLGIEDFATEDFATEDFAIDDLAIEPRAECGEADRPAACTRRCSG